MIFFYWCNEITFGETNEERVRRGCCPSLRLNNTLLCSSRFYFVTCSTTHLRQRRRRTRRLADRSVLNRLAICGHHCTTQLSLEAGRALISIFFRCSWLSRTHRTSAKTDQSVNSVSTSALPNSSIQLGPLSFLPSPHIARDNSDTLSVPARIQALYPLVLACIVPPPLTNTSISRRKTSKPSLASVRSLSKT